MAEQRPEDGGSHRPSQNPDDGGAKEQGLSPRKVKSWLRAKLTRQKPPSGNPSESELVKGFVGGRALRSPEPGAKNSPASLTTREAALAGRIRHPHLEEARPGTPGPRNNEGDAEPSCERETGSETDVSFEDARESISPPPQKTPPRMIGAVNTGSSPTRDSRFVEMMD